MFVLTRELTPFIWSCTTFTLFYYIYSSKIAFVVTFKSPINGSKIKKYYE